MDLSSNESLTGSNRKSIGSNSTSTEAFSPEPDTFSPGRVPRTHLSANTHVPKKSSSSSDDVSRPSSPFNNTTPRSPFFANDCLPRSPSFANDCLPRSPSSAHDRLPRSPFYAIDDVPRSPSFATDRMPRPPSSPNNRLPRPPSPIAGDLVPRSVSSRASGIRRAYVSRPGASSYNHRIPIEGTSRPNSPTSKPNFPRETDRMGLGGNTDLLITFYETGTKSKPMDPGTMSRHSSGSSSKTSFHSNSSLTGSRIHLSEDPPDSKNTREAVSAETSVDQDKDDQIDTVDDDINGAPAEPAAGYLVDNDINGAPAEQATRYVVDDDINGAPVEPAAGCVVDDDMNGAPVEPAAGYVVDDYINGAPVEPAAGYVVDDDINGAPAEQATGYVVDDDINGAPVEPAAGCVVDDDINGAPVEPAAGYVAPVEPAAGYVVDDDINGAPVEQATGYVVDDDINGAPVEPAAGYVAPVEPAAGYVVDDDLNGAHVELTTGYVVDGDINGAPVAPAAGYVVEDDINGAPVDTAAGYVSDEEGSDISGIQFDLEVVGKKITVAADDHVPNMKEAVEGVEYTKDSKDKDTSIDSESFRDKDIGAKDPSQTDHSELQRSSADEGSSLIPEGKQQEAVPSIDAEPRSVGEYSSSSVINNGDDNADGASVHADVSMMSNAPDSLKESWKNLIECNLRTLEMLRQQKQDSDKIHDSFYKEYERLRDEVIRLYEDNGRKRYLVDDIRLKYPGMFDEDDEVRPMNEIMDQHIRTREDKIDMELNMPNIYHQFLKDKLQIERSLGMECNGHPLKAFVDHYNEIKIEKLKDEKQKLYHMDGFPMPDLMVRIDRGKSGKYPIFKVLKDGQHFVMTNNGLIRAMQRHKEMIEEEEENSLSGEGVIDSLHNKGPKYQENKYDCGEELSYRKLDEMLEQVTESTEVKLELKKEEVIERTKGKLKLGVKAINLILQESKNEQNPDNYSGISDGSGRQRDENELHLTLSSDVESRGRRRKKADKKLTYREPREDTNGRITLKKDGVLCDRQVKIMTQSRHGTKSKTDHRVQTPRGVSSKLHMESGIDKKVLPPVIADSRHRRIADFNAAVQRNKKAKSQDVGTPDELEYRTKEEVGDFKGLPLSSDKKLPKLKEIKGSEGRLVEFGYSGYGDPVTAQSHNVPLDSGLSRRQYKRDKMRKDTSVSKAPAPINSPTKTQKEVMRVDNHDYIRKPHPPNSSISPVPRRLPAISKGFMTTTKPPNATGVQLKEQSSGNVRIGSAGRKNKIDVNDVLFLSRHRNGE